MGSDRHYPEEAPVHRVTRRRLLDGSDAGDQRQFREFVEATGYVTFAEIAPDAEDYPGALPHMLKAGSLVFRPPPGAVDLRDWSQWWEFRSAPTGATLMAAAPGSGPRRSSGRPRRVSGRRSLRAMGRQGAADRGRVGVRRARRPRRRRVRLGRRVHARRAADGQHLAGRISRIENLKLDGWERTSPVGTYPGERLRPPRHDRQRVGVDHRLVSWPSTRPTRRRRAAFRRTRAARARSKATTRASRRSGFRARC